MLNKTMKNNIKLVRISENAHKKLKVKSAQLGISIKKLIELAADVNYGEKRC